MKRLSYIGAFVVLGLLVTTLLHAGIEIPLLAIMETQLEASQESSLLRHWDMLHRVGGALLWVSGALAGLVLGQRFWHILYVEKRYGTPKW